MAGEPTIHCHPTKGPFIEVESPDGLTTKQIGIDNDGDFITAGSKLSHSVFTKNFNKSGHGFSVNDPVQSSGVADEFVLAKSDEGANSNAIGFVIYVSGDDYTIFFFGPIITGPDSRTPGKDQYLSVTGTWVEAAPTGNNQVALVMGVAINTTQIVVGMLNGFTVTNIPKGQILQVKSAFKVGTATISSVTPADIAGLSLTITPKSTSSKILFLFTAGLTDSDGSDGDPIFMMVRDSTTIGIPTGGGDRIKGTAVKSEGSMNFLDSPATVSATTYKMQMRRRGSSGTGYLNRNATDTDIDTVIRAVSTIIVMEVE